MSRIGWIAAALILVGCSANSAPTTTPLPSATPTLARSSATSALLSSPPATSRPEPAQSVARTAAAGVPAFDHVYLIVMENHEYGSIVGSSDAPYINSLIAS